MQLASYLDLSQLNNIEGHLRSYGYGQEGADGSASALPLVTLTLSFLLLEFAFSFWLDMRRRAQISKPGLPSSLSRAVEAAERDIANESLAIEEFAEAAQPEGSLLATVVDKWQKENGEEDKQEGLTLREQLEQKAEERLAYQVERADFGTFTKLISTVETGLFLVLGGFPFLYTLAFDFCNETLSQLAAGSAVEGWVSSEAAAAVAFLALITAFNEITAIPLAAYGTFVVEARYGFNQTTVATFVLDRLKGYVLQAVIGVPVVTALIALTRWGGALFYLYIFAFVASVQLVMVMLYPFLIAPLFNRFEQLPAGELRRRLEGLATSLGFSTDNLFVSDGSRRSSHSNAYCFAIGPVKRIVVFDTLLTHATVDETVAVLGHELGHWKLNHTNFMLVLQLGLQFLQFYLFSLVINDKSIYASFGFAEQPVMVGMLIFFSFLLQPLGPVLSFLLNGISRRFEFQADGFAVQLGLGLHLRRGLVRMFSQNLAAVRGDWLWSAYHASHPPLPERLEAAEKLEAALAKRND